MKNEIWIIERRGAGRHWIPYRLVYDNREKETIIDEMRATHGYKYFRLTLFRRVK